MTTNPEQADTVPPLSFEEVNDINVQRCRRWHNGFLDGGDAWTGADWSNAMMGEAGEAANVVKKLRRIETGTPGAVDPERERLVKMLSDELADTFLYMQLLAAFYGIDLPAAIVRKFNAISEREGLPERLRDEAALATARRQRNAAETDRRIAEQAVSDLLDQCENLRRQRDERPAEQVVARGRTSSLPAGRVHEDPTGSSLLIRQYDLPVPPGTEVAVVVVADDSGEGE